MKSIINATRLELFHNCYSPPSIRPLLLETVHNGEFVRYLFASDMTPLAKFDSIRYLNILFNSFLPNGRLDRWIIDESKTKRSQTKHRPVRRMMEVRSTTSDNHEDFESNSVPNWPVL